MRILFIVTLFVSLLIATAAIAGPSGYHVAKTYKIGGDGGWDYLTVDSKARRVYISRGTHVMVVDADTGAVVGDIPNTNGVHGIAIASEFDKGFISDGRDGTITIFDLKTLKVLGTAAAGKNPDAIIYDPVSKRVFSFNGTSKDATAVDAKSGEVAGTIALGGKPEAGVSDGKGHIFVNIEDTSEIVQFDANKLSVENRWKIAPGDGPSGLAMDQKTRRLFSVCGNKMMVVARTHDRFGSKDAPGLYHHGRVRRGARAHHRTTTPPCTNGAGIIYFAGVESLAKHVDRINGIYRITGTTLRSSLVLFLIL